MDELDVDAVDVALEEERAWLVAALRGIADRLGGLSKQEAAEAVAMLAEPACGFIRRAGTALRLKLPAAPSPP